jgi:hypothetical protein
MLWLPKEIGPRVASRNGTTGAELLGVMAERTRLSELHSMIRSGHAILFTGAGFSAEAKDREGRSLPDAKEMIGDLWRMLYGPGSDATKSTKSTRADEPPAPDEPDESSLSDLYDAALLRAPDKLREYLDRRLKIGDAPLPRSFARWFSAPWHRVYTLNVDDLELAVMRQFELPRPLIPISALGDRPRDAAREGLEVVHLNGIAGDAAEDVTFSTLQYASRLCAPDREYERLVKDLGSRPFVFVGTTLDEVVLWKHIELWRQQRGDRPRGHSFLIASHLTRARRDLLESVQIHWIQTTAAEIAESVLAA